MPDWRKGRTAKDFRYKVFYSENTRTKRCYRRRSNFPTLDEALKCMQDTGGMYVWDSETNKYYYNA
jgi:hypothetical protein